jgi:hypothetical protein
MVGAKGDQAEKQQPARQQDRAEKVELGVSCADQKETTGQKKDESEDQGFDRREDQAQTMDVISKYRHRVLNLCDLMFTQRAIILSYYINL